MKRTRIRAQTHDEQHREDKQRNPNPKPNQTLTLIPIGETQEEKQDPEGEGKESYLAAAVTVVVREAPLRRCVKRKHRCRSGTASTGAVGHRRQAARRRRAHPLGSLRAGKGVGDGAIPSPWAKPTDRCRSATLGEEGERDANELGFGESAAAAGFVPVKKQLSRGS